MLMRPPCCHRVARVDDEIHEHLLQLSGIGDNVASRRALRRDDDVFPDETPQHWLDCLDDAIHVEDARLENLLAAEREQLARQR